MKMWELVAREHIRDTLARYNWSGDAGRVDGLAKTFCADGVLEIPGSEPLRGRSAIAAFLGGVTENIHRQRRCQAGHPTQRRQHTVHQRDSRAGKGLVLFHRGQPYRARPFRPLSRHVGARWRHVAHQASQGVDRLGSPELDHGPELASSSIVNG